MRNFFDRTKGSISVFLILILMPMYTCVYLAVDTARYTAAEAKTNGALKLTGNAAIADYNENLNKLYGIFAMSQDEESAEKNLSSYFSKMIDTSEIPFLSDYFENVVYTETADFSMQYVESSKLTNPDILEKEIRRSMKYRAPLQVAADTVRKVDAFTSLSDLANVFKYSTAYTDLLMSSDSVFEAVSESFPENFETNPQDVKNDLLNTLNALSLLEEEVENMEEESLNISTAISKLKDSNIKLILQNEYGKLTQVLTKESIKTLSLAVQKDIQKLESSLENENIENSESEITKKLSYLDNDLYKFLKTFAGDYESDLSSEEAKEIASNAEVIANGSLSDLYSVCNDKCNYEISGLIQHSVWKELYGEEGVSSEKSPVFDIDSNSLKSYSNTFSSVVDGFADLSGAAEKVLKNIYETEYITEMFAAFNTVEDDENAIGLRFGDRNFLLGETEYIIFGEDWMADNIARSVNMIFSVRLLLNSLYAFSNAEMREAAHAVAVTLSGGSGVRVFLNQNLLLFTWSMAESVSDLSILCSGNAVPIYKTDETWNLDLDRLASGVDVGFTECKTAGELLSMTYKDYLKMFALVRMCNPDTKTQMLKRAAGVMQINCAQEDAVFDIGKCFTGTELRAIVGVGMHRIEKVQVYGY